jgi:hypothetical protein
MTWFTVRLTAQAGHLPDDVHLEKLEEALRDCPAQVSLDVQTEQWSVEVAVYELTILGAAREALELIVEAANSVDMPPSDIAALEVKAAGARHRGHDGRTTVGPHPTDADHST